MLEARLLALLTLPLAAACAGVQVSGPSAEQERAALVQEAQAGLSTLQAIASALPQELAPLRDRADRGEASVALQHTLMSLVDRCVGLASEAEAVLLPLRELHPPPAELDRLEVETDRTASSARTAAVQALDFLDAVSVRACRLATSAPALREDLTAPADSASLQEQLAGAAHEAARSLVRTLAGRAVARLVVVPAAVSLEGPSRADSAAIHGWQFSRLLAAALRDAGLPATFSAEPTSAQQTAALVSATLALHSSDSVFTLSVLGLRDHTQLAATSGVYPPSKPTF
ncbi:MAG: hypothetical protein QM765_46810 [Myxococcales bacterium]